MGAYRMIDDTNFFLIRLSSEDPDDAAYQRKVKVYHSFIVGIIKGVLYNLGAEGRINCKLEMHENAHTGYPKM